MNKTDISSNERNYATIISNGLLGTTMKIFGAGIGVYSLGRGVTGVVDSLPDPVSTTGYVSSVLIGTTLGVILFDEGSKYIKKSQESVAGISRDYLKKSSSKESIDSLAATYSDNRFARLPL